jgi:surface antigen
MLSRKSVARLLVVGLLAPLVALGARGTAHAACAADPTDPRWCDPVLTFKVVNTDGRLAVQSAPGPGHFLRWIDEGRDIGVICQINTGTTVDGKPSHTWDATTIGWVYDWYVSTAAQNSHGFSSNVLHCAGSGLPLTPARSIPNLSSSNDFYRGATGDLGPLFNDGADFWNFARVESYALANNEGACQNLVLANNDLWWLDDRDSGEVSANLLLNNVQNWASVSRDYGRVIPSSPVVGAIAVFAPGVHLGWNYDSGHVAVVVKIANGGFIIAEFNWNRERRGAGYDRLDYRWLPWNSDTDSWTTFIR